MARKRYSDEDALRLLREIDVHLHDGMDVAGAVRKAGIPFVRVPAFVCGTMPSLYLAVVILMSTTT